MSAVLRSRPPVAGLDRLLPADFVRIGIVARVALALGERVRHAHLQALGQTAHDLELHRVVAQRLRVKVRDERRHRAHAGILPIHRSERARVHR